MIANVPLGYEAAITTAALFDVSDRGKLELTGDDAPSFLHNLSTNNVNDLPLGGGCEAFFTTHKAKALFRVLIYHVRLNDDHALMVETAPGRAAALFAHLNRYLIAERVELTERSAEYRQFHLVGPKAAALLERVIGEPLPLLEPLQHLERTLGDSATCHVRRHEPLGVPGFDLVCRPERAELVQELLTAAGAVAGSSAAYETLRIEAGTPLDGVDFDENRFVVEIGRTNAISYNKGCYLGQEPIVMARDRAGHVNRQLLAVILKDTGGPVPAGSKVWRGETEIGLTTSSTRSPRLGAASALAYLKRGHQEPGTAVEVETPDGKRAAEISGLPVKRAGETGDAAS